jgi:hypothetical protein
MTFLVWADVANGLVAVPTMVLLMFLARNPRVSSRRSPRSTNSSARLTSLA